MMKFIRRSIKRFIKRSIRKIIKNRKIIAFFLVFTLSFSLVSNYKKEEPKAEVITLTTGTIIACAALATAVGVVITDPSILEDVGTRVYEGIKNIPNAIENVGDRIKINATKQVFDTVLTVAQSLPKVETVVDKIKDTIYGGETFTRSSRLGEEGKATSIVGSFTITALDKPSNFQSVPLRIAYGSKYFDLPLAVGETATITYDLTGLPNDTRVGYFTWNGNVYKLYAGWGETSEKTSLEKLNSVHITSSQNNVYYKYRFDLVEGYDRVSIPYSEENTKSVSADLPQTYFPTGAGSISVPMNKPITDYSPSVSAPISIPNDFVLGGDVVIESDTVSDGVVDDVGDNVGTGEDSLTGVGDSILNPTFSKTIDLSPLYMDLSTKFPFSIPFDIYNLFKDFEVSKKRPVVSYSLPEKYFGTNKMEVDFAFYDDIFPFTTILRYFLLISFVYFLIIKTRDLIGG